jgi:hypothetical protein
MELVIFQKKRQRFVRAAIIDKYEIELLQLGLFEEGKNPLDKNSNRVCLIKDRNNQGQRHRHLSILGSIIYLSDQVALRYRAASRQSPAGALFVTPWIVARRILFAILTCFTQFIHAKGVGGCRRKVDEDSPHGF